MEVFKYFKVIVEQPPLRIVVEQVVALITEVAWIIWCHFIVDCYLSKGNLRLRCWVDIAHSALSAPSFRLIY
jgi:hypothetical protein